jgi:hypothetical protein
LVALLVAVVGVALFYVGLKVRTESLGREIKALETRREALRRQTTKEQAEWARLQTPTRIELALQEHGLEMVWPARTQIVRLYPTIPAAATLPLPRPVRPLTAGKVAMND